MGYTNSSLICYTKLSPNHSGQRTHSIDTLAIHCLPVDETELLTPDGWKKLRDIQVGDIVATSDLWLNIKFDIVQEIIPIRKEPVYCFISGFMGTLKHRMLFKNRYDIIKNRSPWAIGTVEDLIKYDGFVYVPGGEKYIDTKSAINLADDNKYVGTTLIGKITKIHMDSEISCVSVPSGFILIKQNNKTFVVGNCMAGNCTIEACGELFASPSRQASSNYGIGSDGRIAMYVEEKNRSWCTSSNEVDQRAVTIEVANTTTKEPFPITDAAWKSLINLCVDICKRNGIKELKWEGNKALMGNVSRQNMVVHRWTSRIGKTCPGTWLYNNHGRIAQEVNARLKSSNNSNNSNNSNSSKSSVPSGGGNVNQNPEKIIWNFFRAKGLNDYAIAGLMGNLYAESGFISNNLQNTYEKKLGLDDAEYTTAVDNGSYTNFVRDSAGYGLAQWTFWSRKQNLLNYAKKVRKSIGDLNMQCEFLWEELNGSAFKSLMNTLNNASSVKEASDAVLLKFEIPANPSALIPVRAKYAEDIYKRNSNSNPSKLPYTVKINATPYLNIRKGPGTNYAVTGRIFDNGVYTIVDEKPGPGTSKNWGKLKSGAGWIMLDFAIKLS